MLHTNNNNCNKAIIKLLSNHIKPLDLKRKVFWTNILKVLPESNNSSNSSSTNLGL